MGASTVAVMDKLLKNVYAPTWATAFKEEYVGYKMATEEKKSFSGRTEIFPVEYGRGNGVGRRGEAGDATGVYNSAYGLPDPGGPLVENGSVDIRRMFATLQWTHDAIERTKDDAGSFKRLLDLEMKSKYSRMLFEAEMSVFGNGTGCRATTTAIATVSHTTPFLTDVTVDTTRFLVRGDVIAFWRSTAVVAHGGQSDANDLGKVTVYAVKNATTVTVKSTADADASISIGDVIRLLGDRYINSSAAVIDNDFVGLTAGIDDGTGTEVYMGISRTGVTGGYPYLPEWAAQQIDCTAGAGGTTPVTEALLTKGIDKVDRFCGEKIDTIVWDISIRRDFVAITQPDRRYAPVTQLDPGYSDEALVLTAGNKKVKLLEDSFAPFGVALGLSSDNLKFYTLTPLSLDDSTGSVLKMGVPYGLSGTGDVLWAMMRWKGNLVLERPYACCKWTGLQSGAE